MNAPTRIEAARALLAAAWAVVTYAKAQVRYCMSPTIRNHAAVRAAAAKRDAKVRHSNELQAQLKRSHAR